MDSFSVVCDGDDFTRKLFAMAEFHEWHQYGINYLDGNATTLLIKYLICAYPPVISVVKNILLVCESKIDHTDSDGYTALMHAAINYTTPVEVFTLFIEMGANVNMLSKRTGWNALCWALYHEHPLAVIRVLCEAGANVNNLNCDGSTVFYWINKDRESF